MIKCSDLKTDLKSSQDGRPLKVVFVPYLHSKNYVEIVKLCESLPEKCHLIVLTIFSYHIVLKKLVRLKRCTLVNLFCIASEARFAEVLQSNLRDEGQTYNLLDNTKLIKKA
jgi:hypothetical protein